MWCEYWCGGHSNLSASEALPITPLFTLTTHSPLRLQYITTLNPHPPLLYITTPYTLLTPTHPHHQLACNNIYFMHLISWVKKGDGEWPSFWSEPSLCSMRENLGDGGRGKGEIKSLLFLLLWNIMKAFRSTQGIGCVLGHSMLVLWSERRSWWSVLGDALADKEGRQGL